MNGTRTPEQLIGATPLVELRRLGADLPDDVRVFAKLETGHATGSIKDRVAQRLVRAAEESGALAPGATLVEASTGNTAIALAMIARQRGYGLKVAVPVGVAPCITETLKLFGVEVHWCGAEAGVLGAIKAAKALAEEPGHHLVGQFFSDQNPQVHYDTTGAEIAAALDRVDVVVAGIGTGGTAMGVGRRLREGNPDVRVVGVEPSMGEKLQGLRHFDEGWQVPLLNLESLNGRWIVTAAQSLEMVRRVAQLEGLMLGVSSGATLHVALREAERLGRGNVVAICADGGWKYASTSPWEAALEHDERLDELHWW